MQANEAGAVKIRVTRLSKPHKVLARAKAPRDTMVVHLDSGPLLSLKLSPQGHQIATFMKDKELGGRRVGIWDVPQKKKKEKKKKKTQNTKRAPSRELKCKRLIHETGVCYFSWIASGLLLLTAAYDGLISIWNPTTGACMRKIHHGARIETICVSSITALRPVLVTKCDGVTRVWKTDFVQLACSCLSASSSSSSSSASAGKKTLTTTRIDEDMMFTLVRVMGRHGSTQKEGCDLEGAKGSLVGIWRI